MPLFRYSNMPRMTPQRFHIRQPKTAPLQSMPSGMEQMPMGGISATGNGAYTPLPGMDTMDMAPVGPYGNDDMLQFLSGIGMAQTPIIPGTGGTQVPYGLADPNVSMLPGQGLGIAPNPTAGQTGRANPWGIWGPPQRLGR